MSSGQETRRECILRVAELALTQYQAAERSPPIEGDLRLAIAQARQDPGSSEKVENVRALMISIPKLAGLLREQCPAGYRPPVFEGKIHPC